MLEVNEIFGPTIQGEGKRVGNPSIFIRFGKCNMQCPGFQVEYETPSGIKKLSCDSYYASDSAFKDSWDTYESSKPLIEKINLILPKYKVDIVITGGEPLIYWNDVEFQKLQCLWRSVGGYAHNLLFHRVDLESRYIQIPYPMLQSLPRGYCGMGISLVSRQ